MKKFELRSHTADVIIHTEADSVKEIFEASLEGLNYFIDPEISDTYEEVKIDIQLEMPDQSALLVEFLAESLMYMHSEKLIFDSIQIINLTQSEIHAELCGKKVLRFKEDVKAITYYMADIKQDENGIYSSNIVLDI